jgi:hypothetical protein
VVLEALLDFIAASPVDCPHTRPPLSTARDRARAPRLGIEAAGRVIAGSRCTLGPVAMDVDVSSSTNSATFVGAASNTRVQASGRSATGVVRFRVEAAQLLRATQLHIHFARRES